MCFVLFIKLNFNEAIKPRDCDSIPTNQLNNRVPGSLLPVVVKAETEFSFFHLG
jgi:hypothetical protein